MKIIIAASLLLFPGALLPASAGTITSFALYRGYPADEGIWATHNYAPIGVTSAGASDNAFLTVSGGIASGTYLWFFGYEDYWTGTAHPATSVTIFVGYDDSTTKSATFDIGSWTAPSSWTRTAGDASLFLGGAGITGVDRVGTGLTGNSVDDIVLQFSDTGDFGSAVPEPATLGLAGAALAMALFLNIAGRRSGSRKAKRG